MSDILSVKIFVSEVEEPSSASLLLSRLDFFPFRNAGPSPRRDTTNRSKIVLCVAQRRAPCKWRPHNLILIAENPAFGQQLCDSLKEKIAGIPKFHFPLPSSSISVQSSDVQYFLPFPGLSNRPRRLMFFGEIMSSFYRLNLSVFVACTG